MLAYEDGASALLLLLSGTLPVTFRGVVYRFPISVWVPHLYPKESPLVYVTPAEGMAIRAGQHVDPQGKVYHPYLAGWAEFWDVSTIENRNCPSVSGGYCLGYRLISGTEIKYPRFLRNYTERFCKRASCRLPGTANCSFT